MPLQKLTLVGTMHVDRASMERVRGIISGKRPAVVAVELCEERLRVLEERANVGLGSPFSAGLLPWLIALLERAFGSRTGVFPGSEMLLAVEEARRVGARVEYIDLPIAQVLARLGSIPLGERIRLVVDGIVAILALIVGFDRRAAAGEIYSMMGRFRLRYPNLYRVLVTDRDQHMSERLRDLLAEGSGEVVAVVGMGHLRGIREALEVGQVEAGANFTTYSYSWTLGSAPR